MIVKGLVVGPVAANCYIIGDEESREGAIIDPGDNAGKILEVVKETGLEIRFIIATHGHFDHNAGVTELKRKLDADFLLHRDDLMLVQRSKRSAMNWGIVIEQVPDPDGYIDDGDILKVGQLELKIVHTPGHSPGGISIYIEKENVLFSGDTLFQGSIGRTDFEGGSMAALAGSIRERLYTLPDSTVVYTGHGPVTTIEDEKRHNMFVR
ncbi:MAG: MBL fold metallo-hydrolase [bacterium]|nr:MAG: MBL fold metallo-hydrolase [bacterium]